MTAWIFLAAAACIMPARITGRLHPQRRAFPLRVLLTAGLVAVCAMVFAADWILPALAGCIAGVTVLYVVQQARDGVQTRREQAAVADYLGHLVADVRAGATLDRACAHALTEMRDSTPPTVREELALVAAHTNRGGNGADVLRHSESPHLRQVGVMWALAQTHGLPVATLLEATRDRLDTAQRHYSATTSALAGPKATAIVLACLPLAGIAMGGLMGARPLVFLTGTTLGGVLLLTGTVLTCAGVLLSYMIVSKAAQA